MGHSDQAEIETLFSQINAAFSSKDYDTAEQLLRSILERQPEHPRALHALGAIACERGALAEARDYVSRALQKDPANASFQNSMGKICKSEGNRAEAHRWFSAAVSLDPAQSASHYNLGQLYLEGGELDRAVEHLQQAVTLRPDDFSSVFYLGMAHFTMAQYDEALAQFEKACRLEPSRYNPWVGASEVHNCRNRSIAAEELCRKALAATSDHPTIMLQLALALLSQGRVSEAVLLQRQALEKDPSLSGGYSNHCFTLNYDPEATQEEIHAAGLAFEKACCAGLPRYDSFANGRDADRQLRIGYVSADLRSHPVGFHLLPVLRNHDRSRFRIHCYSNSATGDNVTFEFKELCDQWRGIAHLNDEEAAELIRRDEIDILVDLSGHTAYNRLQLFARKPAPVQASWLGYFNTTGLSAIDYLITDDATVLTGEEHLFSEKVLRLPWSRFCFSPYASLPDVAPPPSRAKGYVTFGSFNNVAKLNPRVVAAWARIMHELPGSRLILKRGELADPQMQQRVNDAFAGHGIEAGRLDLRDGSPYYDMLGEYGEVDIALDPFPFSGGLTTLDALLMGVPVVTLSGKTPISRQTRGFLRALNLLELVSRSEDGYCAAVCALARDPERLERLRGELRGRVLGSYLCDGREFTRNLEHGYRTMWQGWCQEGAPKPRRRSK